MTSALLIERYRDSATMTSGCMLEEAMSSRDDVSNQQLSKSYQQFMYRAVNRFSSGVFRMILNHTRSVSGALVFLSVQEQEMFRGRKGGDANVQNLLDKTVETCSGGSDCVGWPRRRRWPESEPVWGEESYDLIIKGIETRKIDIAPATAAPHHPRRAHEHVRCLCAGRAWRATAGPVQRMVADRVSPPVVRCRAASRLDLGHWPGDDPAALRNRCAMAVRRFAHVCATMLHGGRPDVAPLEACWPTMGVAVHRCWSTLDARWPRDGRATLRAAVRCAWRGVVRCRRDFSCGAAPVGRRSGDVVTADFF
ncbi:hypothetical protein F511_18865 [Dorcoceras hygrometricum]|uniref:Uncharacterized protein n=1 Tax=Dorcoceras hygrometricum TaxID=472368 RepID=A0A2Z7A5W6_9LAMI|nr:hypothetical protein F511_18865 [Dorcoceras hygrometricum]